MICTQYWDAMLFSVRRLLVQQNMWRLFRGTEAQADMADVKTGHELEIKEQRLKLPDEARGFATEIRCVSREFTTNFYGNGGYQLIETLALPCFFYGVLFAAFLLASSPKCRAVAISACFRVLVFPWMEKNVRIAYFKIKQHIKFFCVLFCLPTLIRGSKTSSAPSRNTSFEHQARMVLMF